MEDYLNKHDKVKVEVEELELMMSPEDSEVNLRYIFVNAGRESSEISEIPSAKERSEHFVASKVRQEQRETGRETSYEGTPVKAPPNTRRRMMPPTPPAEERQWQAEM